MIPKSVQRFSEKIMRKPKNQARTQSPNEKAAALLLMMGKPPAARLLKQFDQPDLRAVALAAAGLGAIPAAMLDQLVEEFVTDFSAGADLLGDAGQAKSLLGDALPPEQIADLLGLGPGEAGPPNVWQSLARAPESTIVALLMGERAATATYILSRLDPALAWQPCSRRPIPWRANPGRWPLADRQSCRLEVPRMIPARCLLPVSVWSPPRRPPN